MGAIRRFARSLVPGNDHQLARTQYAGRESASAAAARKRRERHHRHSAAQAARQGEAWETRDRRRFS